MKRYLISLGLLVAAVGAAWWWFRPEPVTPPLPAGIEERDVRQAIEEARHQVLAEPDSADAWGHLGLVLMAHLFAEEADFCFAQAVQRAPSDARWPYGRGLIALKREPDKALPYFRQAAALADHLSADTRSAIHLQLADVLLEREQFDEAVALFRQEQRQRQDNPRAAMGLGLIAAMHNDDQAATKNFTIARESPFAFKKASAQLAALARGRNDLVAADTFEKETAQAPDDPPWPDPLLDEMIRLQVGRRGRERRAAYLEQHGHYKEAADLYLQQIEEQPTARAYVGAGIGLARLRQYDRAFPLLRKAVEMAPESAHAQYSLGLALFSRAEREWQFVVLPASAASMVGFLGSPLTPEPPFAASALALERTVLAFGAPHFREWLSDAVKHTRLAAQLRPTHSKSYLFWGLSLKYLNEPAAAIEPLRKGIQCNPSDFELQFALGEVLLATGQRQEAATHFDNASRLRPSDARAAQALERLRHQLP
jgi:tetratricopeptide (TPR) repeat protein